MNKQRTIAPNHLRHALAKIEAYGEELEEKEEEETA